MDVLDQYVPDPDRYEAHALPPLRPQRAPAARRSRSGSGRTSATTARSRPSARSCAAPSTSASRTSTWPTTTARRYGSAETNFGRILRERLRGPTATSWSSRPRPATTCGPGPTATGARASTCSRASTRASRGWGSTTSTSSTRTARPGHAARGDDGRAGHGGAPGQGALRRHLVLLAPRAPPRRRASCASSGRRCSSTSRRTRCSTAGSRRSCSTCSASEGVGCIVFSPLAQGMLTDKYLDGIPEGSRARPGRLAATASCSPRRTSRTCARSNEIAQRPRARRWRRWRSRGCCATRA